ncbi:MAG: hypothetical protein HQK56_06510 [Deltaproteobacteria bacterium]|nr:hypothetical protein [Deltaproteobacteria bacterium]
MPSPEEFLLDHVDELMAVYQEHPGEHQKAFEVLCQRIPGMSEALKANTFKTKAPTIVATVVKLRQSEVGQVAGDQVDVGKLTQAHNEAMDKLRQESQTEMEKLSQSHQTEVEKLFQQVTELTSTVARLTDEVEVSKLNHDEQMAKLRQGHRVEVNKLSQNHEDAMIKLTQEKQEIVEKLSHQFQVKKGSSLDGWTIELDRRGYYRAYKSIKGKVHSVYLGKVFNGSVAKDKIAAKMEKLRQDSIAPELTKDETSNG